MRRFILIRLLRLLPGARATCIREGRVLEGMLIFLQQKREELAEKRILCADRNLYLMGLEEDLKCHLLAHRMMMWDAWRIES